MKIIFDTEEQKEKFLNDCSVCPSECGFRDIKRCLLETDCCVKCYEQSGIEIEVNDNENHI